MTLRRRPTIKLVDHRGRTVTTFETYWIAREGSEAAPEWCLGEKPASFGEACYLDRLDSSSHADRDRRHAGTLPTDPVDYDDDGQPLRLNAPGLTLRWQTVVAVLDKFADAFTDRDTYSLTVDELRNAASRL